MTTYLGGILCSRSKSWVLAAPTANGWSKSPSKVVDDLAVQAEVIKVTDYTTIMAYKSCPHQVW